MSFERARTNEQIQERKREIIKACSELYNELGIDGVHFKAISKVTSFARSTIYTYYKTKEEILMDLLLEDTKKWSHDISVMIESHDTLSKEDYCHKITNIYVKNSRMLQLLSLLYSILEKNCSLEKLTEFKIEFHSQIKPMILSIYKYFPNASDESKQTFLYSSSCFITGLYPATNISQKQKDAMRNANIEYQPLNFTNMCYKGLLALASDLK